MLNTKRLLQFGTIKPIPKGATVVYLADSFDVLSKINEIIPILN